MTASLNLFGLPTFIQPLCARQVCNRVLQHITVGSSQVVDRYVRSFVIDYTGCPILFEAPPAQPRFDATNPRFLSDIPPMGEADIKFLRWVTYFNGDAIAFSIDGDFIPIALMFYEEQLLQRKLHEQRVKRSRAQADDGKDQSVQQPVPSIPPVHRVAIYRFKYKPPKPPASAAAAAAAAKRASQPAQPDARQMVIVPGARRLGLSHPLGNMNLHSEPGPASSSASGGGGSSGSSSSREYEYVNIPRLFAAMRDVFDRFCPAVPRNPLHR